MRHGWMTMFGALGLMLGCDDGATTTSAAPSTEEAALAESEGAPGAACLDALIACVQGDEDVQVCRDAFVACIDDARAAHHEGQDGDDVADGDHQGPGGPGPGDEQVGDEGDCPHGDRPPRDGDDDGDGPPPPPEGGDQAGDGHHHHHGDGDGDDDGDGDGADDDEAGDADDAPVE